MKTQIGFTAICFLLVSQLLAQSTTTRDLPDFNKIYISGGFDKITLREGNETSVKLTVSGVDSDKIITEVKNNALEIGMKNGNYRNYKASAVVTYRKLNTINNSGSTDFETDGVWRGDELHINTSGSGDFKCNLDAQEIHLAISGSSDMLLSGKADAQFIAISGSGDVNASDLKGKSAKVSISGSGDVSLNVDGPVKTSVSGSGDVVNH